ncbi:hypothetical protein L7F22_049336 [Adiantum nelumboides]|nr:hypothetical protein [Adiantum nelumboides]
MLMGFSHLSNKREVRGETSKRGLSTEKGVENPYQELKQLLEGKPSSKKKGHAQHERSPSREREESESSDESMEDVAPRRRRAQRSPTPTKRKRSPHSPHRRESKREEKNSKKKKERKRSPSSPSSLPSSSSDEGSGYSSQERQRRGHRRSYATWKRSSKLKKFKEGGKNISFLTYDGNFGATDKVLAFIQQFDAAFGDEGFTESSKLRHVAMHFQKFARQWWASLRANGEAPKTWKALRASIMKQSLASDAKDKVLTEWRSLKLSPYESIHKYVDKFWDLHLNATVYKKIDFEEQKQQFCARLPEDMNEREAQGGVLSTSLGDIYQKFIEARDAFGFCLKGIVEEELAIKDEGVKTQFVEFGVHKFRRNVVEPDKISIDMGGKVNLEHQGQIEANELQKIELLNEDNVLGRGSRATSKYTSHALIHYLPKLDKDVLIDDTPMLVNYLVTRLQQATANPALQGKVQQQLHAYGILPTHQEERDPVKSLGETSKRGLSIVREGENPYEELQNVLLEGSHPSKRRGHAQRHEPPSKEKERRKSPDKSMEEDVAP